MQKAESEINSTETVKLFARIKIDSIANLNNSISKTFTLKDLKYSIF